VPELYAHSTTEVLERVGVLELRHRHLWVAKLKLFLGIQLKRRHWSSPDFHRYIGDLCPTLIIRSSHSMHYILLRNDISNRTEPPLKKAKDWFVRRVSGGSSKRGAGPGADN
jgi:hypothetical protein